MAGTIRMVVPPCGFNVDETCAMTKRQSATRALHLSKDVGERYDPVAGYLALDLARVSL